MGIFMSLIEEKRPFKGLNNNQLKIIAMISMALDHIGVIFPNAIILRCLGRLAFPIYAYMIAEGCRYTKNRKKYFGMIAVMAVVFQIVYFFFMNSIYQSILVNFSLSIATIFAIDSFFKNKKALNRVIMILIVCVAVFIEVGFPIIFEEQGFYIDYNVWGFLLPILVYFAPSKLLRVCTTGVLLIVMTIVSGKDIQWFSLFTVPLLMLYNETRGSKKLKYLFYIFYPLHLVIIYGILMLLIILKLI